MKFWGLELNFSLYCGFPFRCIALSETCRINLPFRNCTLSGLCFSVMWTVSWCFNAAWGVGEQWPASGCGRQAWQLWMLCRCLQTPSSTAEGVFRGADVESSRLWVCLVPGQYRGKRTRLSSRGWTATVRTLVGSGHGHWKEALRADGLTCLDYSACYTSVTWILKAINWWREVRGVCVHVCMQACVQVGIQRKALSQFSTARKYLEIQNDCLAVFPYRCLHL